MSFHIEQAITKTLKEDWGDSTDGIFRQMETKLSHNGCLGNGGGPKEGDGWFFFTLSFGYLKSLLLPASINFQNSY